MRKTAYAALLLVTLAGRFAYALPGDLDSSFGSSVLFPIGSGKVTANLNFSFARASAVAIQSDGKIVVAGAANGASEPSKFAVVRFIANGGLDSTFGPNGIGFVTTAISSLSDEITGMALQGDGKIVVVGTQTDSSGDTLGRFALARYNSDGSLDSTFGSGGKVTGTFGSGVFDGLHAIAVERTQIVVAGNVNGCFGLMRFNSDGSSDTNFGNAGQVTTCFGSGFDDVAAVAIQGFFVCCPKQARARIVAIGSSGSKFALAAYNLDGSLDTSFGTGGKVTTDFGSSSTNAAAIALQTVDGKIVVAGSSVGDFALARYNFNGSLDTSFGTGGKVTTNFGTNSLSGNSLDAAFAVAIQPDNKIVVAGQSNFNFANGGSSTDDNFAVARYNVNGTLDTTFSGRGKLTTDFGTTSSGRFDQAKGVAIQRTDGRIVAAGTSTHLGTSSIPDNSSFALARYHAFVCHGKNATIVGTNSDDTITGTSGPDVIVGLGGNDTIDGAGGDDTICGTSGHNTIKGGDGNDTLDGGSDDSVIDGGGGTNNVCIGTTNSTFTNCQTITRSGTSGISGAWDRVSDNCHPFDKMMCKLKGTLVVRNPRTVTTGVPFFVAFYLSSDRTLDENDTFLGIEEVGALQGLDTDKVKLHTDVVSDKDLSGNFVIAVLDFFNDVPEANENDNIVVSPPLP